MHNIQINMGLVETNYKPSRTRSPPLPILCVLIPKSREGVGVDQLHNTNTTQQNTM